MKKDAKKVEPTDTSKTIGELLKKAKLAVPGAETIPLSFDPS